MICDGIQSVNWHHLLSFTMSICLFKEHIDFILIWRAVNVPHQVRDNECCRFTDVTGTPSQILSQLCGMTHLCSNVLWCYALVPTDIMWLSWAHARWCLHFSVLPPTLFFKDGGLHGISLQCPLLTVYRLYMSVVIPHTTPCMTYKV
jgi:hypothetical protein